MRIREAPGLHYCTDCTRLIIDEDHDSVWYCDACAIRRGANIIDGRPIKIEKQNHSTTGKADSTTQEGKTNP